jgi:hypothetical protein
VNIALPSAPGQYNPHDQAQVRGTIIRAFASLPSARVAITGLSGTGVLARNLRGSATFAGASSVTVTFPLAEADGSYFLALGPGAAETFWITGKGASGFTLHSSNATSTATVDWHLLR